MPAGYSGTPLPKKLGLKDAGRMALVDAPPGFENLLDPLPAGAIVSRQLRSQESLIVLFCANTAALRKKLAKVSNALRADGSLWISWPKKTSPLFVDLTEDMIRTVVLPTGLVDVKVCAVDADWSGLKLMVRKELRDTWPAQR